MGSFTLGLRSQARNLEAIFSGQHRFIPETDDHKLMMETKLLPETNKLPTNFIERPVCMKIQEKLDSRDAGTIRNFQTRGERTQMESGASYNTSIQVRLSLILNLVFALSRNFPKSYVWSESKSG